MLVSMSALFLLLGCCSGANALLLPRAPSLVLAAPRAARPAMGAMGADQCAVIELTGTEPILLAKTLRSAWMEAGVKRGLTGTVIIPEEGEGFVQVRKRERERKPSRAAAPAPPPAWPRPPRPRFC